MGTTQCCSQPSVDHQCLQRSPDSKVNYFKINTNHPEIASVLPPQTVKIMLGINVPYSPIPTPPVSPLPSFHINTNMTPISPIHEAPDGVEEFDDVMSVAMDVMSPEPSSRKHIITQNRRSADTIDTINSVVIENDIYHTSEEEEGEHTQHYKKKSNLIQVGTSDTWDREDMDELAQEMRNQLVLLQYNSTSALYSNNTSIREEDTDESDSEDEDTERSPSAQSIAYNVNVIVTENVRLMEEKRDQEEENIQQSNIIKEQQLQIEALQRMVQELKGIKDMQTKETER